MPTTHSNYRANMPMFDDGRGILYLEAVSELLKKLVPAIPLVFADGSPDNERVYLLLAENERVRQLLARHGLDYELLRVSVRDMYLSDYSTCHSHMNKRELTLLLFHIMGVVINQGPYSRADSLSLDVAKLEEATYEAATSWCAEKRAFLTQLFRVLYTEESYRRGTIVCYDFSDPEFSQNRGDLSDDVYCQQPNQTYSLSPLSVREAESNDYRDDETGFFPWKVSMSSTVVVVRGCKYYRQVVLVLESDIHDNNTGIYDEPEPSIEEYYYWGEGLHSKEGKWYEINRDEVRLLTVIGKDEVWDGDDGQKYRKSIGGLHGLFVGLTREVVIIDNVRHVAHLVLRLICEQQS